MQVTEYSGKRPVIGVLLVHGLNGSRRDMAELAAFLRSKGMITENILLPGHGTQVSDMFPLGWAEWSEAVSREVRALKKRCDLVFLIGHSLGGALCLHIASHEQIAGIVTMCAPLHMFPWTRAMVRMVKRITPVLPTIREDIRDPEARRRYTRDVYRWTPMAPVESMLRFLPQLRAELPDINAPVLIMASRHDHVVPVSDAREIYHLLGSREKHLITFHRSYHVIMKDHDRAEVFSKTLEFIQRHASRAQVSQEAGDLLAHGVVKEQAGHV
jgi:carboxylesterase